MGTDDDRRSLSRALDEIARGVSAATIEAEMGAMCRESFFQLLHRGGPVSLGNPAGVPQTPPVTQAAVDEGARRFSELTARLMPPELVRRFIEQACAMRVLPEVAAYTDLVPGFTEGEAIAGADATTRRASRLQRFTRREVLDCLAWNERAPEVVVAIAHATQLVATYAESLRHLVARHSPEAATKLVAFARQWAPKNVLKFLNVALHVTGRKRAGADVFAVDAPLIAEAMDLLNHAGAFTWEVHADASVTSSVTRIHCPAHRFLHLLFVTEGALVTVLDFVTKEAARRPPAPAIVQHLELARQRAIAEATGVSTFGAEWSRMKLET